jgi:uncharacterized Zn-finger protein
MDKDVLGYPVLYYEMLPSMGDNNDDVTCGYCHKDFSTLPGVGENLSGVSGLTIWDKRLIHIDSHYRVKCPHCGTYNYYPDGAEW